jgi:hypothetical protein
VRAILDAMRTIGAAVAAFVAFQAFAASAAAATRQVGAGQTYATPCAAIDVATANDEIDVAPGTYTDSCEINVAGLTLKGVGGQPKIDLSGTNHPADYKGIYVVSADDVTIENLELTGAHIDDGEGGNAAGIRATGHGLVVHGCYIHDNQNGVLAAPTVDGGTITIEYTELSHNGLGDACDQGGCVHNVYVSKTSSSVRYDKTVFQFNWSHDLADDTADKGHLLKSRSRETDVLYNRITGESGHDSYEVDIPNGGLGIVVGNVIEKGTNPDNSVLLAFGEEGIDNPAMSLYVAYNTFVNDFTSGTFIDVASGATLTAHDNVFAGPGTPASTGALSTDNLSGTDPLFVDPAAYDYHLMAGSPAIGKAISPGSAGAFSLDAVFEYVQPIESVARASDRDLGAFEYGTVTSGAGADAGVDLGDASTPPRDAGTGGVGSSDAGSDDAVSTGSPLASDGSDDSATAVGGEGGAASARTGSSAGCGCVVGEPREPSPPCALLLAIGACLLRWRSSRRRGTVSPDREWAPPTR